MRRVCLVLLLVAGTAAAGPIPSAAAATPITDTHVIAVGEGFACAVASTGVVRCWGSNFFGALGDFPHFVSDIPVVVNGVASARAVAASFAACALLRSGAVECWGSNTRGIRGDGRADTDTSRAPTLVTGITNATAVSMSDHACALLRDGTIACWGANEKGQLGNGQTTDSNTPVRVAGITNAIGIATGNRLTCALLGDHTVRCWGSDSNGALGTGGPALGKSLTPVSVAGVTDAVEITSGRLTSCARLTNGNVKCWGANLSGELGDGTRNYGRHPKPVKVQKVAHSVDVAMGNVGCAALGNGSVRCWGSNAWGGFGNGQHDPTQHTAVVVQRVAQAVQVSVGSTSACAVIASGQVRCWGFNEHGELGGGTISQASSKALLVFNLQLGKQPAR